MKLKESKIVLQALLGINNSSALMYGGILGTDVELTPEQENRLGEQLSEVGKKLFLVNNNFLRLIGEEPQSWDE